MPNAYLDKLVDEGKGTKSRLEHLWSQAKEIAKDEGRADDYAYITGIFKRSAGIKASLQVTMLCAAVRLTLTNRKK
jgi:hypothetical protein